MPYADLGDYKFYYKDYAPDNEANGVLCFLHAFTLDHRLWEADAEFFSQFYRVIVPDLKGHGRSDAPESGYSRADRVEDINRFLDKLGLKQVHLIGLSYGGTTGIGLALKYPERLKSLTLVGTSAAGYDLGPKMSKLDKLYREQGHQATMKRWITTSLKWYSEEQSEIKELVRAMMESHSGAIFADSMRGKYRREYDLEKVSQITIPTNIIVGELDKIFLPLAKDLHDRITSSKLTIFDQIGHLVNLESPNKFQDELKLFLEGQSG